MRWVIVGLLALYPVVGLGDCKLPDEPKPEPKPQPTYPTWQETKPLLEKHCAFSGCHDGSAQANDFVLDESLFLAKGYKPLVGDHWSMPPLKMADGTNNQRFPEYVQEVRAKILLYLKGKGK